MAINTDKSRSSEVLPLSLRDSVFIELQSDILKCILRPGEELRENELAARFNISKQPVREALQRLERDRLVVVMPRQGYRVAPVSLSAVRDVFRLREVLEPAAAMDVAKSADDAALRGLDQFGRPELAEPDFIAYNRAFHCAIAKLSPYQLMGEMICDLVGQADRFVHLSIGMLEKQSTLALVTEHVKIIDALQARNGRLAASLLREHVVAASTRIVGALSRSAVIA